MLSSMKTLNLINSSYSREEAHTVVFELLNDKISFLGKKILSNAERNLDTSHYEARKAALIAERDSLRTILNALDSEYVDVVCDIQVIPKEAKKTA